MNKVDKIIALLLTLLGNPYVWGGKGESLTGMKDPEKWITGKEDSANNVKRALAFYRKVVASGKKLIQAFDCSGLVAWPMKQVGIDQANNNADTLYGQCRKITKDKLRPGSLVFIGGKNGKPNSMRHVGWFVGMADAKAPKGYTIEAYGRDKGVVMLPLVDGEWTHYGDHPKVLAAPISTGSTVEVIGNSVNIRAKADVLSSPVDLAHKGDRLKLVAKVGSFYQIGDARYISAKPQYTRLV